MKRNGEFTVLIGKDEDGVLVGLVPGLRGCHSQAKDLPTLLRRIKEAILLCIESQKEPIKPLKFVGVQEVAV